MKIKIDLLKLAIAKDGNLQKIENIINENENKSIEALNKIFDSKRQEGECINYPNIFNNTELKHISAEGIKSDYKHNYTVIYKGIELGVIQWEKYGFGNNHAYFKFYNKVLYTSDWLLFKQAFNDLKLTIDYISKIDLAVDTYTNITHSYFRIISNKNNEIIINGKIIKDRDKLLHSPYFITYGTLNNPIKEHTIYLETIDKSIIMRGYNKSNEISNNSDKNYIFNPTQYYGDIWRCEVSINAKQLNKHEYDNITPIEFLSKLEDDNFRVHLFKKYLSKLFRYSSKNKKRKTFISI